MARTANTVALVGGVLALIGGIWGLVDHQNAGDSEGALEETIMWIAIALIILAISQIANAVAARGRDLPPRSTDRP